MKPNSLLFWAGLIAAFTAAVHTLVGTREIYSPLLGSVLAEPIRLLLYACWHLVTITLILSAAALLRSARVHRAMVSSALPLFIGVLWLAFAAVFMAVVLVYSGARGLLILPQWTLLIPVGVLAVWGATKSA